VSGFDDDEETTSPETKAAKLYDPSRKTDAKAREHANADLVRAAYVARLEARHEVLRRRLEAAGETIRVQRREIERLRKR
jgi:hypothetical protein